ncbi:MAG: DUF885 family protein [Sphingopyxis sp.]|uniref:DUF885 domain-containing protein n=1 Tax=Sphingopyxis sp. TaxID=1908224 RepID=UPI002AB9CC0F|nr:DUF885 family protein [Sphingopyxis sp.]MDZ3830795.1 DUF885 family protein [Sphingopyxis sp.]
MESRRHFLTSAAAVAACCTVRPAFAIAPEEPGGGKRLISLLDDVFGRMMDFDPAIATALGLDVGERQALKARWKASGPDNRLGAQQALIDALPRLRGFDRSSLGGADPYHLDTVIWAAERAADLGSAGFGTIDNWPTPYVINQISGSYQNVPLILAQQHGIETAADADAYLERLADFARLVAVECDMAAADADRGMIAPDFILDLTIAQAGRLRAQRGRQSDLVASLVRRTAEHNLAGDWERRATRIVEGPLAAALDRQHALLLQLRARATDQASLGRRPGGGEFYAAALRMHVTTAASVEDVHRVGVAEVAELGAKIDVLLRAQGMTRGSVAERLVALNTHPAQVYPNDDIGRARIIADLERLLADVRARMPNYFNDVPAAPIEILRVPKANELGSVAAYAVPGSADNRRPGAFYINLRDTAAWPRYALPTLAFHEAIPGHLWNSAVTQRTQGVPAINQHFYFAAYSEGWALYAEELAEEAGLYDDDPFGRIGLQQALLLRAARIVADTGIHAMGWGRQQAVDYMVSTVGMPLVSAQGEVDRYCVLPGQACGYKVGHSEFKRLLAQSRRVLGSRFDLKAWHDAVLSGSMPLEVLGGLLKDWEGRCLSAAE